MFRKMKAIYHQGVLSLEQPLPLADGTHVRVAVSADEEPRGGIEESHENSWEALNQLLKDCSIDTGVSDLARSHDHYLYGTDVQSDKWDLNYVMETERKEGSDQEIEAAWSKEIERRLAEIDAGAVELGRVHTTSTMSE